MSNLLWGEGEDKDFGKMAIEYAAGDDVILDQAFVQYECLVNQAHILMLYKQKIISFQTAKKLLKGLKDIIKQDQNGKYILKKELEDVHSNIEMTLIEKYGIETGGYLRLGIARNDQVYTDTRMFIRDKILTISKLLIELIVQTNSLAQKHILTVMPGYTHLRVSQPVTYAHYLTSKCYHFLDDLSNITKYFDIVNQCPLGIFEMAGTHLNIDRKLTAGLLGFDKPTVHSLYTANLRGELEARLLAEFSFFASHVRKTMNEIILFSTNEFDLVKISHLYTTGGTAQPNLENPDTLEVLRAKMAEILPAFVQTMMNSDILTSGYNRDSQETKPILFGAIKTIEKSLPILTGIISSLVPNEKRMLKNANLNFSIAPSVAVQISLCGGISFRQAHKTVKTLIKKRYLKKNFEELTPALISKAAKEAIGRDVKLNEADIKEFKNAAKTVVLQKSQGGPAPEQVKMMTSEISKLVNKYKNEISIKENKIATAKLGLEREVIKMLN